MPLNLPFCLLTSQPIVSVDNPALVLCLLTEGSLIIQLILVFYALVFHSSFLHLMILSLFIQRYQLTLTIGTLALNRLTNGTDYTQ